MYLQKTIGVVVPSMKRKLIAKTLMSIPSLVDKIIVVDDCSNDRTGEIVKERAEEDRRIVLIEHKSNQGVGGERANESRSHVLGRSWPLSKKSGWKTTACLLLLNRGRLLKLFLQRYGNCNRQGN